jgi:hypothetical protein
MKTDMNYFSRLAHRISRQRASVLIVLVVIALALLQPLLANAKPLGRDRSQLAGIAQSTTSPREEEDNGDGENEDSGDEVALPTATATPTRTPAANQSNNQSTIAQPTARATAGTAVDDTSNLLPFTWEGEETIAAADLAEVAPPLEAEVVQGDFQISFVEAAAGAAAPSSLRILPVLEAGDTGSIRLGATLDPASLGADFPAGETVHLQLTVRAYAPEATARLAIADDTGSSSVPIEGLNWQEYQVTRAIDADATAVEFFVEWTNVPANGWLEMRGLSLSPLSGSQAATTSPTDTPTRVAAATPSPTPQRPTATPTAAALALATATPVPDMQAALPAEPAAPVSDTVFVELTPTATFIVVTSTPTPVDVLEEATRVAQATEWARILGPVTPTPPNLATPTPTLTPFVIVLVKTPTPENAATTIAISILETAVAFTTGTPTPFPPEATVEIATDVPTPEPAPTATPTPMFVLIDTIPTAAPAPTVVVPAPLHNKIIFLSTFLNQPWAPNAMLINPDGSEPALMTHNTFYYIALEDDKYSPDKRFHVFSQLEAGGAAHNAGKWQLFYDDRLYNSFGHQLTYFGAGVAWAGAFAPDGERVALVSSESGNDEIWVAERQKWPPSQLTHNEWEWDHHPSFSPDGSEIVFSSNRVTGRRQLWMMTSSGGDQRQLTNFTFEAWDPVWIKYVEGQNEEPAADEAAAEGETEARPGK